MGGEVSREVVGRRRKRRGISEWRRRRCIVNAGRLVLGLIGVEGKLSACGLWSMDGRQIEHQ